LSWGLWRFFTALPCFYNCICAWIWRFCWAVVVPWSI
jgi:hypothetical protein